MAVIFGSHTPYTFTRHRAHIMHAGRTARTSCTQAYNIDRTEDHKEEQIPKSRIELQHRRLGPAELYHVIGSKPKGSRAELSDEFLRYAFQRI